MEEFDLTLEKIQLDTFKRILFVSRSEKEPLEQAVAIAKIIAQYEFITNFKDEIPVSEIELNNRWDNYYKRVEHLFAK